MNESSQIRQLGTNSTTAIGMDGCDSFKVFAILTEATEIVGVQESYCEAYLSKHTFTHHHY